MDSYYDLDTVLAEKNSKKQDEVKEEKKEEITEVLEDEKEDESKYRESTRLVPSVGGTATDEKEEVSLPPRRKPLTNTGSIFDKKPSQEVNKEKKPKKRIAASSVSLRSFPTSVLQIAQKTFPDANTKADAVAAFIIVNSSDAMSSLDVSDEVRRLVRNYKGDKTKLDTVERLDGLDRQVKILSHVLRELELGIGYLLFDRLGYRKDSIAGGPSKINMTEDGMLDLIMHMREETIQMRKEEQYKNGRPMK